MDERRLLLENALDVLDRLFDHETGVVDVYAIIFATSRALPEDVLFVALSDAATDLEEILRANLKKPEARDRALISTGKLRQALAEAVG